MRAKIFDYSTSGVYFLTICTQKRQCILSQIVRTDDLPAVVLTECGKVADRYLRQMSDFYEHISVRRYVIMPNHIHLLLCVASQDDGPSRTPVPTAQGATSEHTPQNAVVSKFVSTFKRLCNKEYGRNIWQSRSYDHIVRDRHDYETREQYICENPSLWCHDELYVPE